MTTSARGTTLALAALLAAGSALAQKLPSYDAPQPAVENLDLAMYARIRTEGLEHSHVMQFASALADGIGPRLTGSPNLAKANAWTRDTLTTIGLENAHLEDWGEFGLGWQQINTWARMVSPDPEPLWMQAAPWSTATNGPVTGDAVYLPLNSMDELNAWKGKLAGKIVLLGPMRKTPDLTKPLFKRYTDAELEEMVTYETASDYPPEIMTMITELRRLAPIKAAAAKMLATENVAAIILPTRDGGGGGGTGIIFDDNTMNLVRGAQKPENAVKIPNAVMMIEHYNRIARMLE